MSTRQARRIRTGHSGSLCGTCRGGREIVAKESDYRYWLNRFGVTVPNGTPALEAVRASGLPPDLAHLAVEFADDFPG